MSDAEKMVSITESVVEDAALAGLENLGYVVELGPDIAPRKSVAERDDYGQVGEDRLCSAPLPRTISGEIKVCIE